MFVFTREENLAMPIQARVIASISAPTGGAARDPSVLLNESSHRLDDLPLSDFSPYRTYDTYDGQNQADTPDWYALQFSELTTMNCIEMTMGMPYRDGGWWTSLLVEIYDEESGGWQGVKNLIITPPYDFDNERKRRLPYETYALLFEEVTTRQIRLIGMPGGIAHFTSLARLAAYRRDLDSWDPTCLPTPPVPHLFRLIPPQLFFDLSESLTKLTGLTLDIPHVEYYLDELRFERHWQMWVRNYQGEPKLWFFLGDSLGWYNWFQDIEPRAETLHSALKNATVCISFHEAAVVDGANRWQQIWHVTLPGIRFTMVTILIITMGWLIVGGFEQMLVMYNGAVYSTGDILETFSYRLGITENRYELATAVALFQAAISLILVSFANAVAKQFRQNSLF